MSPERLLSDILIIVPEFASYWKSADNYFINDNGTFTIFGVCAENSYYVRDHYSDISREQMNELCLYMCREYDKGDSCIKDAIGTCWLENLSHESFSKDLSARLTGASQTLFEELNK